MSEAGTKSDARWYIVHTYSNFEKKVAEEIKRQAKIQGLDEEIVDVIVPTEEVIEVRRGQKVNAERKFLPGYVLLHAKLTDECYHLVKNVAKVTGFLGQNNKPMPLRQGEVDRILNQVTEGAEHPKSSITFEIGEQVTAVKICYIGIVLIGAFPDHLKANLGDPRKAKLSRGGRRHINNSPTHEGATVVDSYHYGAAGPVVCNPHLGTEGQRSMRSGHSLRMRMFTACSPASRVNRSHARLSRCGLDSAKGQTDGPQPSSNDALTGVFPHGSRPPGSPREINVS